MIAPSSSAVRVDDPSASITDVGPAKQSADVSVRVVQLGAEDSDARIEAIRKLVATEDPRVVES